MTTGLRRSSLYVPGDNERMLRKATMAAADMLLLNLEDGVAPSRKDQARANVVAALRELDFGRSEKVVRINAIGSEAGVRDLAAVVPCRPDGICLPKVESSADVRWAETAVLELEDASGLVEGALRFHAMIESAWGVIHCAEIAAATERMASLIFGSADFVREVGCRPGEDRAELTLALQQIVLAARSAGIDAIDAPCFEIRNSQLLRREALQARQLGFDGKNALHPDQVPVIHEVFAISSEEISWARRVLEELEGAEQRGSALSTLDGRLIDNPHRSAADRILKRAALMGEQRGTS